MKAPISITLAASLLLTLPMLVGCATQGATTQRAGNASTSLETAALSVARSNAQLETVLRSLSDLVNNPGVDLQAQYNTYNADVNQLDALATEVTASAAAMQEQGTAYFGQWDEDLAKIQNENIRTRSVDRRDNVTARFEEVRANYTQTKGDFAPFVSNLKDIRTALGTDLTAGGLASVRSLVTKADRDVIPLRNSLRRLEADFRNLGVSMSSASSL